jgi:hypothetical protein
MRMLLEQMLILGCGQAAVWWRVTLPLVRPGVAAGFGLVFLTVKELPATLLLAPIEFTTLATQVWGATNEALFDRAAGPALAIVVLSALPLLLTSGPSRAGTAHEVLAQMESGGAPSATNRIGWRHSLGRVCQLLAFLLTRGAVRGASQPRRVQRDPLLSRRT